MNKLHFPFLISFVLLIFLNGASNVYAEFDLNNGIKSHQNSDHFNVPGISSSVTNQEDKKQTFVINNSITDLNEFKELVVSVSRLKKFGKVQVNIGVVAEKAFYEIPLGGNPWSEYASNFANLYKFYPDKKIEPFIPQSFIQSNRKLLLAKAKILRDNGMEAAFFSNEPEIMPSAFFEAYPHLRGPRVDHPRRSNVAVFSPCLSVKEMQDMYSGMMAEMLKNVPEIKTFYFKTNDAGSGNCWSDWLYVGANGPAHCKHETTGMRIENLMNALKNGADKAGTNLDIYLSHSQGSSNFSDIERTDIQSRLPKNCYFASTIEHPIKSISTNFYSNYPVKGIFNVPSFLNSLTRLDKDKKEYIFLSISAFYDRANESPLVSDLMFQLITDYYNDDSDNLTEKTLRDYCLDWAGEKDANRLYNALVDFNAAGKYKSSSQGSLIGIYWNVSSRTITRPLLVAPQRLNKEEEAYFLPYVFNVSEEEARMDYLDIHGGRWKVSSDSIKIYVGKMQQVWQKLDSIDASAPRYDLIKKMSAAIKVHASLIRSIGNFATAQKIRDNNAEKLKGPKHRPSKEPTWEGDKDLLTFNEVMRDELDNTTELIEILQQSGTDILCLALKPTYEDCFLLGPDIISQLKKKSNIMLDHWRDIEDYMTTPFK